MANKKVAVTPGAGEDVAFSSLGGALGDGQVVKLDGGADGASVPIVAGQTTAANSLPVVIASNQSAIPVSDGGGSLTVDGSVTVSDGGGSLTVDGTVAISGAVPVTDNGGSLTVDDGGGSLTVDGTVAVSGNVAVTLAAGAAAIAKAEDVAAVDGDVGVPAMAVRKAVPVNTSGTDGDYEMLQMANGRLWVDASGVTLTVGSHAVTNAGTFAVQATVAAGATNIAKAEDVASADADVGVPAMAVRKAAPGNTSGTDGDYEMLQMSAGRLWVSATIDAALPAGANAIGKLAANDGVDIGDVTINNASGASAVNIQDGGNSITVDGTVAVSGNVAVTLAAGAAAIAKAEDVASADADVGVPSMAVRKAAPANTSGTDGDYEFLQMSAGRLWVSATIDAALPAGTNAIGKLAANDGVDIGDVTINNAAGGSAVNIQDGGNSITVDGTVTATIAAGAATIAKAEDAASVDGDVGVGMLAVRKATPANTSGTDGDYEFLQMSAGRLWASTVITDASGNVIGATANALDVNIKSGASSGTQYTEDAAAAADPVGTVPILVRKDAPAGIVSTDGDNVAQRGTNYGAAFVQIVTSAGAFVDSFGGGTEYTEDAAAAADPIGKAMIVVRDDARAGGLVSANGDNVALRGTNAGELYVKQTDVVPVSDNGGNLSIDDGGNSITVDGTVAVSGNVAVTLAAGAAAIAKAEDVASADADVGVPSMAVRKAAPANTSGTDGDYEFLQMSAGRLWVSATIDAALPAGTNAIGKLAANDGVDIGDVTINNAAGGSAVNIQDGGNSITVDGTVTATIAAGAATIAKAEDVASVDADVGVPAMAVRKAAPANTSGTDGDYEFLQMSAGRLWVDASGVTLTVGSHAVTNAGTFATQDSQVKAEDAASANADNLFPVGAIRRDTPVANDNVTADGDYTQFKLDNTGKLWVAGSQKEDDASADGDRGMAALAVRKAAPANTSGTDGDYEFLQMSAGRLWVSATIDAALPTGANVIGGVTIAAGAAAIAKAEDVASVDADVGVPAMAVRKATPANSSGTDGDYEFLQISAGLLWVHPIGDFVTISTTATRPADTTAYTANDAWENATASAAAFTFTGAARVSGGSGIITDVVVTSTASNPATMLQGELWIFDSVPGTIPNDNAAFDVADADIVKLVAVVPFTLAAAGASACYAHVQNLSIGFTASGSADLKFLVKVKNAYTPANAEPLQFRLKILQTN